MKKRLYSPCNECRDYVVERNNVIKKEVEEVKTLINLKSLIENGKLDIGAHARRRSDERRISMLELLAELKFNSKLIELQKGTGYREYKLIFRTFSKSHNKPVHTLILVPREGKLRVINTYFPTEGMSFKWDRLGLERKYFNVMRSCCVHPEDSVEDHYKPHHGIRHGNYSYQKITSKN